jgi:hypothetical protein
MQLSAEFICYADQDDIWLCDKTQKLLNRLLLMTNLNQPALIFSDVEVVDQNLNLIHPSFSKLQQLNNHEKVSLKKLLFYCPALGCTMMLNKPLFKLIINLPDHGISLNHDKWALIIASISGKIFYLPESTVKYRQHSSNVVGAMLGINRKVFSLKNFTFLEIRYQTAYDQAQEIHKIPFLSQSQKKLLTRFNKFFTGTYIERFKYAFMFILTPPSWQRKFGLLLSLMFHFRIEDSHAQE